MLGIRGNGRVRVVECQQNCHIGGSYAGQITSYYVVFSLFYFSIDFRIPVGFWSHQGNGSRDVIFSFICVSLCLSVPNCGRTIITMLLHLCIGSVMR